MRHLQPRQLSTFTWGFNDITGLNLPECGTVTLFLNTTQQGPQPPAAPYSLIVYPAQGLPSAYPLSLTGTTAPWTVNYPAGTRLMLNIADASGNSGGVPPEVYTVQSNQSTACLPSTSTPVVTMKIDEPSALKTCTVLPIHIEGGQKPYTVTLAVANSVAPTNKTLGSDHDTFEWVNQAAQNSTLIIAVSDSKGQYALASKLFLTTGSTDASCPGQTSRSYNSNNSTNNNNGDNSYNNNNNKGGGDNNQKSQTPIGAIIGAAVGAMVLLGLVLLVFFRRKNNANKGRKGGVGLWERKRYHRPGVDRRPSLDNSPDGSQAPFTHHDARVPVRQNQAQPTTYTPPASRSSAALSYYGDPTSPNQNTTPRYLPPSTVLAASTHQQGPGDQQRSSGYAWQPSSAYPPSSSMLPPDYPQYNNQGPVTPTPPYHNQGTVASTGQRASYHADVVATATHLSPQRTPAALGTGVYNDNASRQPRYTVQNATPGEGGSSVQGVAVSSAAETRQAKGKPPLNQPPPPSDGPPVVYQHEDARAVVELPPAYREWSAN